MNTNNNVVYKIKNVKLHEIMRNWVRTKAGIQTFSFNYFTSNKINKSKQSVVG